MASLIALRNIAAVEQQVTRCRQAAANIAELAAVVVDVFRIEQGIAEIERALRAMRNDLDGIQLAVGCWLLAIAI